jgi:hypothetical protein
METLLDKINKGEVEVSVVIEFYCVVPREQYDLGVLTLKRSTRTLMLDVVQTYSNDENHHTTIECDLEYDEDLFSDKYKDLKESDLLGLDEATLFIGHDWEVEPDSITLFVKSGGSTRAIDLEID